MVDLILKTMLWSCGNAPIDSGKGVGQQSGWRGIGQTKTWDGRDVAKVFLIEPTGLDDSNGQGSVFCESGCEGKTSSSSSNDDIVVGGIATRNSEIVTPVISLIVFRLNRNNIEC